MHSDSLNIGLVISGFSSSETDWCIPCMFHLVKRLSSRVDLRVFPLRYPFHKKSYTFYNAQVFPQGGQQDRKLKRIHLLIRSIQAIIKEHQRQPFTVLHAFWVDEPGFVAVWSGRLLHIPVILSLMGGELVYLADIRYGSPKKSINRKLAETALRNANRVLAGSMYASNLAAPFVSSHEVTILPIGTEHELFKGQFTNETHRNFSDEITLLHAASLYPVKDQETLLKALRIVVDSHPNIYLKIAGSGILRPKLDVLVDELRLSQQVNFLGAIPHDQMPRFFQSGDVLIHSSRHESQEIVTMEAALSGITTIGTRVGVLPDIVPEEQIVAVRDHNRLASAILRMISDRERLRQSGLAAQAIAREKYTSETSVTRLEALYQELAHEH